MLGSRTFNGSLEGIGENTLENMCRVVFYKPTEMDMGI